MLPTNIMDSKLVDLPQTMLFIMAVLMFFSCYINVSDKPNAKPHVLNILLRGSSIVAIGHIARGLTYLSTSPPGSADHCLAAGNPDEHRPTFAECFYRFSNPYMNCGDLMFSGHIFLCLVIVCLLNQYGVKAFWIPQSWNNVIVAVALVLSLIETILIISARHHYTADVVVAWYLTPLLVFFYNNKIHPLDLTPNRRSIALKIIKTNDFFDGPSTGNQMFHEVGNLALDGSNL